MIKKLKLNTITSLILEIVKIVSGIILPRFILKMYGSDVNGLVNSIANFLSIISFLELGVGAVIQSSLYKPLANNDDDEISKIMVSAKKFFNRIGTVLIVYIIVLIFVYPLINGGDFGFWYIASIIIAMGIDMVAQYYFGIVNRLLLSSDQKGYIHYTIQIITIIINTIACIILIDRNVSIQVVKFTTALIYLIRPVVLMIYVNKNYSINYSIKYSEEPIKQKWNGIAQHIAAVILNQTDNIVLTFFSSLKNVSIYSVYFLVINGIKTLVMSLTSGILAIYGELWAKKRKDKLLDFFEKTEWLIHTGTVFLFGCTAILIVPFVQVYTKDITDTNYIQPVFAVILTIAHAGHCLRLPYNMMILAAGHYKETQHNYIIASVLNISISIIFVKLYGLIGVAIGTLVAMLYQTMWMAWYNSRNLLERPYRDFIKQLLIDSICIGLICFYRVIFADKFCLFELSYINWIVLAIESVAVVAIIIVIINAIFYGNKVLYYLKQLFK